MMLGTFQGIISPKRRVAIPSSFRRELGERFILAKWYEGCLVLVGKTDWTALLERLKGSSKLITRGVRDTDRFILGSAYEISPDEQGRVVIPSSLAMYAAFKKKLSFIGLGDRVEVWDKEAWEARERFVAKNAGDLLEKMADEK